MKVLLVIYSCKKYSFMMPYYLEKYSNLGYNVYYLTGDEELEDDCLLDKESKTIKIKCKDNFENLSTKTYYLLQLFNTYKDFIDYDYIIKMDDDTELNLKCEQLLTGDFFQKNLDYMGHKLIKSPAIPHNYHFGKCEDNILNLKPFELNSDLNWGCGYFYILSKKAVDIICGVLEDHEEIIQEFLYEDMMVGKLMQENQIEFNEILRFVVQTDLPRPRKNSLSLLSVNKPSAPKVVHTGLSKMRKVVVNVGSNINNENNEQINDENSDKLNMDIKNNRELDKKVKEINKNNLNSFRAKLLEEEEKRQNIKKPANQPVQSVTKLNYNPKLMKSHGKVGNKVTVRR